MKLTMRDKVLLLLAAACLCAWGEYNLVLKPIRTEIVSLRQEKDTAKGLLSDISPLLRETAKLKETENQLKDHIETIKSSDLGKTITNEEFLVFIGNSTAKNNVNVTGYNNLGIVAENDIYKMIIDMEMKGSGADINKVLTDMDSLGIKYSIGSVSYRQNEQYDYLKRFYDDLTDLPWYEEPDEEEIEEYNKKQQEILGEFEIPDEELFVPEQNQGVIIPELVVPSPEPIPEQTPEPPKNIDERLDQLLELTAYHYGNTGYEVKLLTNNNYEYKEGQDMRLAITVCLIMFDEPAPGETIFYEMGEGNYGIL